MRRRSASDEPETNAGTERAANAQVYPPLAYVDRIPRAARFPRAALCESSRSSSVNRKEGSSTKSTGANIERRCVARNVTRYPSEDQRDLSLDLAQVSNRELPWNVTRAGLLANRADTPDCISDVVCNQKRSGLVDSQSDRPPAGLAVRVKKIGDNILRFAIGMTPC